MPETAAEYAARQDQEWSQYTAVAPVIYDGVIAAQPRTAIPASHPSLVAWLDAGVVAKNTTKAAKALTGEGS